MYKTGQQSLRVDNILQKNIIDKYKKNRRRLVLEAWKEYMADVRYKKAKVVSMVKIFKNLHLKPAFDHYKRMTLHPKTFKHHHHHHLTH